MAELANPLQQDLADKGWALANVSGSLEVRFLTPPSSFSPREQPLICHAFFCAERQAQLLQVQDLIASLPILLAQLEPLQLAEDAFVECRADYNDHTVHSYEELAGEFQNLERRAGARKTFIENQVRRVASPVARGAPAIVTS